MGYTYIITNNKFFSYLTGGTSINDLDTAVSTGIISGTTNDADYENIILSSNIVTGYSTSRLNELKKFAVNVPFNQQYIGGGSYSVDGVDFINSISGVSVIYFIGGIRYVDTFTGTSATTTFDFTTVGILSPAFINKPIYKDPKKENIISNPKITSDVFIIRQELSAFENNYKLEHIRTLNELETYAGGKYFNIVKNS
jgi:hypothetical protein